jgi:TPP-dependent pyruvate/acetoin dehydrogenase alpha subunit
MIRHMGEDLPASAGEPRADDEAGLYAELYRTMVLIRRFEEAVHNLFLRGEIYGSTHLCIGQEAVSAGTASVLRQDDLVAATYRGHGHAIALGSDPQALLDELTGRQTGTCAGRSGSMNVVDREHRLIGCFGIVGGSLGAATGAALGLKRKRSVGVGLFGDGAVNQAYFYECLNFAKVAALPVVYVCENNQYGEFTPAAESTAGEILDRPRAMGIPAVQADGQDVWAVREVVGGALETARTDSAPVFVEALTYRYSDHGRGDPIEYRPEGEMERWKQRDPLDIARARLAGEYGVPEEQLTAISDEVEDRIREMTERSLAAPFPDPDQPASQFAPNETED